MCGGGGGDGPGAPLWIVSFSDMIANLVTFFIVMATFNAANQKGDQFKKFTVDAEPGIFGGTSRAPAPDLLQKTGDLNSRFGVDGPRSRSRRRELSSDRLLDRLTQSKAYNVKPDVADTKDGIRITLEEQGLFPAGSTAIKASGRTIIEEAGNFFRGEECQVRIEAHVDDLAWRSSGARSAEDVTREMAVAVASILVEQCGYPPPRVSILPAGASQPAESNDTPLGRSKNRRVILVFGRDP